MKGIAFSVLVCGALSLAATSAEAGCWRKPNGPYGGPCYTCGGRGFQRGYTQGFYGYGSWGYYPGYSLGSYGYGPGFNQAYWGTGGHTQGFGTHWAGFGIPVRPNSGYFSGGGY